MTNVSTTIKWLVVETVDPSPFDPCRDIPLDVAFDTSYGVIQQSLFYSPIYAGDDVDCLQTKLQRARELSPHYIY